MIGYVRSTLIQLMKATSSCHRPWQIALAVSLGGACGILPLGSVVSCLSMVALFFLPLHLPLAIATTIAVGFAATWITPSLGELGFQALSRSDVKSTIMELQRLPLVPWLRLNNTVVLGSLVVGAAQLLPTFALTYLVTRRLWRVEIANSKLTFQQQTRSVEPQVAYANAVPSEVASDPDWRRQVSDEPSFVEHDLEELGLQEYLNPPTNESDVEFRGVSQIDSLDVDALGLHAEAIVPDSSRIGPIETESFSRDITEIELELNEPNEAIQSRGGPSLEASDSTDEQRGESFLRDSAVERVESLLAEYRERDPDSLGASEVAQRASELASLVDEMLDNFEDEPETQSKPPTESPVGIDEVNSAPTGVDIPATDLFYAEAANQELVPPPVPDARVDSGQDHRAPTVGFDIRSGTNISPENGLEVKKVSWQSAPPESDRSAQVGDLRVARVDQASSVPTSDDALSQSDVDHEEALRYLLNHLKQLKDRV